MTLTRVSPPPQRKWISEEEAEEEKFKFLSQKALQP